MSDTFVDYLPTEDPERRALAGAMWVRRAFVALFAVIVVLALLDVFGQHESATTVVAPAAIVRLKAPHTVRGGVFFQSRVDILARRDLKFPSLVLADGWFEGMQANSITPQPPNENALNGHVQFGYGELPPGHRLRVWMEFEVNPTNVGNHQYDLALLDGNQPVARIRRTITVVP
jgi:hypothetical protein